MNEEKSSVPSIPIFTTPVRSHMMPTMAAIAKGKPKVKADPATEDVTIESLL